MSDQQAKIEFKESMTADKRNQEACYLRHNVYPSRSPGLYPTVDFQTFPGSVFASNAKVKKVIGYLTFVQDGADIKLYSSDPGNNPVLRSTITGKNFLDAVEGNNYVHLLCQDGSIYKTSSNTSWAGNHYLLLDTLTGASLGGKTLFDGIFYYYFFNDKIYKQLKEAASTLVFNDTGDIPLVVDVYGENIVLFFSEGLEIKVSIWGKADIDFYDKTILIDNAKLLGGGVVDGTLLLVKSVGNRQNTRERNGEIVISGYDGENFKRLNSIKAANEQIGNSGQAIGNEILLIAINNYGTHNTTLYNKFIYKIKNNGSIETIFDKSISNSKSITCLDVQYDYVTVGIYNSSGGAIDLFHNVDRYVSNYGTYNSFSQTEYVTAFLNNAANRHKLDSLAIVFEKLFDNDSSEEKLVVSYRVSEREDFIELGTVTAGNVKDYIDSRMDQTVKDANYNDDTKGLTHQIYSFEKLADANPLPEYNEIQFKFVSSHGFSVIDAWYNYSYITRNQRK